MFRNEYEIRIWSMRQSGCHAIANWIRGLFSGHVVYLNNKKFTNVEFFKPEQDKYAQKECLVIGFENRNIKVLAEESLNFSFFVGDSKNIFNIVMLRDIFNMVASNITATWHSNKEVYHNALLSSFVQAKDDNIENWEYYANQITRRDYFRLLTTGLDLWRMYALEYLNLTNFLDKKISLSFNEWFKSRKYRNSIAKKLGVVNKDVNVNKIAKWTSKPLSRFDYMKNNEFCNNAQELKVLERWKHLEDNPIYCNIFRKNKDVVRLNKRIFGNVIDENLLNEKLN